LASIYRTILGISTISLLLLTPALSSAGSAIPIESGGLRFKKSVTSFHEIRHSRLVRQGWDISCGAAALSTILQYYHKRPFSETAIVLTMLKNTDPQRVRARGGFSLLDLKRFVGAIGFKGVGYGDLSLEDIRDFGMPAIIPVRIRGYDHFVVLRGIMGNRVFLGDPAFGNLTMTFEQFGEIWKSRIGFFVYTKDAVPSKLNPMSPDAWDMMVPDLNYISRSLRGSGPVPPTRRPPSFLP
jgi:predicted double-glycine peptidase